MSRITKAELRIPEYQGAVVCFRGRAGFAYLAVRGCEHWYLTRRDAAEQDILMAEITEDNLRSRVGSEFTILHQGGYNPAKPSTIQWPNDPSSYDPEEP